MVTARASMAVFDKCERIPSGLSVPICKCGVSSSISSRNPIPSRNPTAAGITDHAPLLSPISIAGISSDHTDAATITPDAKPSSDFCNLTDISPFIKKTKAEPSIVPSNGISSPMINIVVISSRLFLLDVNLGYATVFHALELAEGGCAAESVAARGDTVMIEEV